MIPRRGQLKITKKVNICKTNLQRDERKGLNMKEIRKERDKRSRRL